MSTTETAKGSKTSEYLTITLTPPGIREDLEVVRAHYESRSGGVPVSGPMAAALAIKAARAQIEKGQA